MGKRNTTSIDKDADAEEALEAYCKKRGAMKKVVVSRLILWFVGAPDSLKDAVQDWIPEEMRPDYIVAFRKTADKLERAVAADLRTVVTGPHGVKPVKS